MSSEARAAAADERGMAVPLIQLQAWPGAVSSFRLSGSEKEPQVAVMVSVQPGFALPGPAELPRQAALGAHAQAEQYRLISSQLAEAGLTVSVLTTLDPGQPMPIDAGGQALRRLAQASALAAEAAAAAKPAELTGVATVEELLDRYGLLAEQLADAYADQPLNRLLAAGQPLAMRTGQVEPDTVPADISTLGQVAARLRITPARLLEDNRGLRLATDPAVALPGTVILPAEARTAYQTQAGDTLAALAARFGTTAREVVADNAEVGDILPAGVHVEIGVEVTVEPGTESAPQATTQTVTASTDTVAGDSFQSLLARLAGQHAGITLDAVADELDQIGAVLSAGVLLTCPLAVLGSGRGSGDEGPLTAAEVQAEYGCQPADFAAANAAVLGLLQPGTELRVGASTVTTAADDTLNAVLGRLHPIDTPTITDLISANLSVPLFRPGARAMLPAPPVTLTATPGQALRATAAAAPLVVTLRLERSADTAPHPSNRADSVVPPATGDQDALIDSFLAILPAVRLAADTQGQLWAISFGDKGIAKVQIAPADSAGPHGFALRPLYAEPVDFSAWIRPVTATGTLGAPTRQHYRAASVEPWAQAFLADLDAHFRQPLHASLPEAVRAGLHNIQRRLADAIADGLAPVLRDQAENAAALRNARIAVASLARGSLTETYRASVIAQYGAVVSAPYGSAGLASARLGGVVTAAGQPDIRLGSSRVELNPSHASCTFAVTNADPAGATSVSIRPDQVIDGLELGSGLDDAGTEPVLLRFARSLTGSYLPATVAAGLPPAELPIPLREHPSPVVIGPMTAEATYAGTAPPTLAEAMQWTASLTYTHEHAAQDVIELSWSEPPPTASGTPVSTGLAEALAAYTAVAAVLVQLIGAEAEDGEATARRNNAGAAWVELAVAVAAAWSQHWAGREPMAPKASDGVPAAGYRLRARYTADPADRRLDRLVVTRARAEDSWPVIALAGPDQQVPLVPGPVTDETREYVPATSPLATHQLTFRLDWPGRSAAPRPDARVSLVAERNGVLRAGVPTSPAFLLASPVGQVDVARPSVRWPEELPLTGANLAEALQNAFDVLAGEQPEAIRLSLEAGYAEPVGELRTVLPVLLLPELALAPDTAGLIAARLEEWLRRYRPATAGAQWRLRLAVLSAHTGEAPLLTFDQLVFPVATS